ncbi:hypothetical protein JCM10449v2_001905 [Rhodotorula kratochvilovae]
MVVDYLVGIPALDQEGMALRNLTLDSLRQLSGCWRAAALWARAGAVVFDGMPSKLKFDEDLLRGWLDERQALATKAGTKVRTLTLKAKTMSPECLSLLDGAFPHLRTLVVLDVIDPRRFLGGRVKELVFTAVTKPYVRASCPDVKRLVFKDCPTLIVDAKNDIFRDESQAFGDLSPPSTLHTLALSGKYHSFYQDLVAASPLEYLHLGVPLVHVPGLLTSLSSPTLKHLSISVAAEDIPEGLKGKERLQSALDALDEVLSSTHLENLTSVTIVGQAELYPLQRWLKHLVKRAAEMHTAAGVPIEVREIRDEGYEPLLYHPRSGQLSVGPGAAVARVRPNFDENGFQ